MHVRDLPKPIVQELHKELNCDVAVGFAYQYYQVYWGEMWTWGGRFVLYEGAAYWELDDAKLVRMLGRSEYESLKVPFQYRFPFGLTVSAGLAAACAAWWWMFPSKDRRARKLLNIDRYQEAMRVYSENRTSSLSSPDNEHQSAAFSAAVSSLVATGIPTGEARTNLRLILGFLEEQQAIRQEVAISAWHSRQSRIEQSYEWEKAIEVYQRVADLSQDEQECEYLRNCIQDIRAKQARLTNA